MTPAPAVARLLPSWGAASAVLSGRLDADLHGRLRRATLQAHELLGRPAAEDRGQTIIEAGTLPELISGLRGLLAEHPGADPEHIVVEHEAALERLRQRFDGRLQALARAHAAVAQLRGLTSPATVLASAPPALCQASNFERVILSQVGDGWMVAQDAHFAGDPAGMARVLEALRADPIRLEHPLIETELLRRRRATIIVDAQVHPRVDRRLAQLMGWSSYAAAPLVVGSKVVGVLHADRGRDGRLDVLDRDVLWEFASALAQAYETVGLMRTLRREREQMRRFLDWLSARSSELTDAPIRLATMERRPSPPLSPHEPAVAIGGRDDRAVFEGLLTRRELDVLRLLADGDSNKAIAEALVISDGTVKFHVNSILRKLRASNRAEAVSRYLRLLGMRAP